jgi:hypothetical protein
MAFAPYEPQVGNNFFYINARRPGEVLRPPGIHPQYWQRIDNKCQQP